MDFLSSTLQIKTADSGTFTGIASAFGQSPDRQGDLCVPGCFQKSLQKLGIIPLLWQHDQRAPIGGAKGEETESGLEIQGHIATTVAAGKQAYDLLKTGGLSLSIGYQVSPGGSEKRGNVRFLTDVDLHEISLVSVPADLGAKILDVKSLLESPLNFERALRDHLGLSNRESKRLVRGGFDALVGKDESDELLAGLRLFNLILKGE